MILLKTCKQRNRVFFVVIWIAWKKIYEILLLLVWRKPKHYQLADRANCLPNFWPKTKQRWNSSKNWVMVISSEQLLYVVTCSISKPMRSMNIWRNEKAINPVSNKNHVWIERMVYFLLIFHCSIDFISSNLFKKLILYTHTHLPIPFKNWTLGMRNTICSLQIYTRRQKQLLEKNVNIKLKLLVHHKQTRFSLFYKQMNSLIE